MSELVGPAYLAAVALLWGAFSARAVWRGQASRRWPRQPAVLLRAEIGVGTQPARVPLPLAGPVLAYSYEVAGFEYTGRELAFGWQPVLAQRPQLRAVAAEYAATGRVLAAYDPVRPGRAVLVPGVSGWAWASLAGAGLTLGLAVWWAATLR